MEMLSTVSAKQRYWLLVRLIVLPAGLGFILYLAGSEQTLQAFAAGNAYLVLGLLISQLANFLVAVRLRLVLRIVDVRLTMVAAYRLYLQSMYYYFFLPIGAGSEVSKFVKLRTISPHTPAPQLLSAIISDRALGFAGLVTLGLLTTVFANPLGHDIELIWIAGGCVALLFLLVAVIRIVPRLWTTARQFGELVRDNRRAIFMSYVLSIALQTVLGLAVFFGAVALGIPLSFFEGLFGISTAFLFQAIPLTIGGASGAELAGVPIYIALGLSAPDAVLIVSTIYSYRLATALIGGIWELLATRSQG